MVRLSLVLAILTPLLLAKHPQKIADGEASNAAATLEATVYVDPESIQQALGNDLEGHYTVIRIKLTPRADKLNIQLDDFLLRTDKDGERSHPFVASQIAGQGALIVTDSNDGGGGKRAQNRPSWGLGGFGGGMGSGNVPAPTSSKARMENSEKKNPLQQDLETKMLPEKETNEPAIGFLYFPMEKQKVKDLELIYTTPSGKLSLRFK